MPIGAPAQEIGAYAVLRRLDVGGMAEVFLAQHRGEGGFSKRVVIKQLLPDLARDQKVVRMFLDEARLAARLSHPNIVQVNDVGDSGGGAYFIAMEYLDGESLRSLLVDCANRGVRMDPRLAAHVCARIADALHYAHTFVDVDGTPLRVIHRDVKPSNIFVTRAGYAKLIDFGIAKAATQVATTGAGMVKGTLRYMAPEQLTRAEIDHRVDVYALGLTLYEALVGPDLLDAQTAPSQPSAGAAPRVAPLAGRDVEVAASLAAIVDRATAQDRDDRHATARELQRDLDRWVASSGAPLVSDDLAAVVEDCRRRNVDPAPTLLRDRHPDDPAPLPEARPGRRRVGALAALALVALASTLGGIAVWRWRTSSPPEPAPGASAAPVAAVSPPASSAGARADDDDAPAVEPLDLQALPPRPAPRHPARRAARHPASPVSTETLYNQANKALLLGKFKEARRDFREVLRLDPRHTGALRGVGYASAELGDTATARLSLRRYLDLAPNAPDAATVRARLVELAK